MANSDMGTLTHVPVKARFGGLNQQVMGRPPGEADAVWAAEELAKGADPAGVRQSLVNNHIAPAAADQLVSHILKNPIFAVTQRLAARVAKRDWTLDIYARNYRQARPENGVPRLDKPSADTFFRDYYYGHRPVIITGAMDDWPAFTTWSLDYFAGTLGDAVVEVQANRDAQADYELQKGRHTTRMAFGAFVERLRAVDTSNDIYLTAANSGHNRTALDPLWRDIRQIPPYLKAGDSVDGFLWIGPKGTLTPFHHDLTNNLLTQVIGRKRVLMVPSFEVARMGNHQHCFSQLTREQVLDAAKTPDGPTVLSCDIAPGEALFLPIGWWHHVEALDLSVSVSFTNFDADNDFYSGYRTNGPV